MRSPSGRICKDTISIYYAGGIGYANLANSPNVIGADGGYSPMYNASPDLTNFPCSVQFKMEPDATTQELDRVTEIRTYSILCRSDPAVDPRDMIIYVDNSGNSHTLFVDASNDQAGRGGCWRIRATERR